MEGMENSGNGLYPMIMMHSPSLSHHHQHHNSHHQHHNSHHHNGNNSNIKGCCCSSSSPAAADHHQHLIHHQLHHLMGMENYQAHNLNNSSGTAAATSTATTNSGGSNGGNIKTKIMSHPHYPRLLSAFVSCQKVGAPPEVMARLEEAEAMMMNQGGGRGGGGVMGFIGEDPALDQFMEAYCEMLTKYEQELTKPFKDAMLFLSRIECQFKALTISSHSDSPSSACGEVPDRNGSSEEDIDVNNNFIDPSAEDRELKGQLLRKYSGYLGSLRQEFLKKRKKGKLPKEARQQLLDWWSRHYKWPYPSESQKLALAESTGLDQKQINNWFINQRKRHWKPSEDMQLVVMDAAAHSHAHPHYGYMDNVLGTPFPMDVSPTLM